LAQRPCGGIARLERLGDAAGAVFLTLRVAVTGARRSPPLQPVMKVLGEEEVERRLGRALEALRPS
jgi:glutamyl/glutaminyl-tRNA synthetase